MRREKEMIINDRGNELRFKIKEMSAMELDSWLTRLTLMKRKAGFNEEQLNEPLSGMPAAAESGFTFEEYWPLMNEMLACCRRVDAGVEQVCTPGTVDSFISDVRTIQKLRTEALKLNLDFTEPGSVKGSGCREVIVMGKPQIKPSSLNL